MKDCNSGSPSFFGCCLTSNHLLHTDGVQRLHAYTRKAINDFLWTDSAVYAGLQVFLRKATHSPLGIRSPSVSDLNFFSVHGDHRSPVLNHEIFSRETTPCELLKNSIFSREHVQDTAGSLCTTCSTPAFSKLLILKRNLKTRRLDKFDNTTCLEPFHVILFPAWKELQKLADATREIQLYSWFQLETTGSLVARNFTVNQFRCNWTTGKCNCWSEVWRQRHWLMSRLVWWLLLKTYTTWIRLLSRGVNQSSSKLGWKTSINVPETGIVPLQCSGNNKYDQFRTHRWISTNNRLINWAIHTQGVIRKSVQVLSQELLTFPFLDFST